MGRFMKAWMPASALAVALAAASAFRADAQSTPPSGQAHWVGSWGAPPAFPNGPEVTNQTIRQIVRLSLGGRAVRIRVSNEMGTAPLVIGAARLARPGREPGSIDPASDRVLTFGGRSGITVPPGAPAVSDPVALDAKALDSLAADHAYLTAGGVFTPDLIESYIELKMTEVARVEMTPHPVEFDMYYSV